MVVCILKLMPCSSRGLEAGAIEFDLVNWQYIVSSNITALNALAPTGHMHEKKYNSVQEGGSDALFNLSAKNAYEGASK